MNDTESGLRTSIWKATNQIERRIESKETTFEYVQRHPEMYDVRNFIDIALGQLPTDSRRLDAVQRMKSRRHHQFVDVLFELFITSHVTDCGFVITDRAGPDIYVPGAFAVEATVCHSPKHKSSGSQTALLDELRDRLDMGDPLGVIFSLSSKGYLKNSDGISPKSLEKEIRKQVEIFVATGEEHQSYLRPDEGWRNRWQYIGPLATCLYESDDWSLWIDWMAKTTKGRGGIGAWPGISFVGEQWPDGFRKKLKAKAQQVIKWDVDVPVYLAVGFPGFFDDGERDAVQDVWCKAESSKRFCGLWVTNFALSSHLGKPILGLIPPTQGEAPSESSLMIPRLRMRI